MARVVALQRRQVDEADPAPREDRDHEQRNEEPGPLCRLQRSRASHAFHLAKRRGDDDPPRFAVAHFDAVRAEVRCEIVGEKAEDIEWVLRTLRGPVFFPLRALATGYVDLFRGVPLLIALYLIGFGVPALRLQGVPTNVAVLGTITLASISVDAGHSTCSTVITGGNPDFTMPAVTVDGVDIAVKVALLDGEVANVYDETVAAKRSEALKTRFRADIEAKWDELKK